MAAVAFVWELGAGMGHVVVYRACIDGLIGRGHDVVFVARDVAAAQRMLGDLDVRVVQAPILAAPGPFARMRQHSYADLLWSVGYADRIGLRARVKAWHRLFEWLQPQVVVADHAPTALLAGRARGVPCIPSGSGFLIPPPKRPLPVLRFWETVDAHLLQAAEDRVMANVNAVLDELGVPALERLWQLFDAPARFLLTFPELDHYDDRGPDAQYLGLPPSAGFGDTPAWPAQSAKGRLMVYLSPGPGVEAFLKLLPRTPVQALVYAPGLPAALRRVCEGPGVRVLGKPLDVARAAAQCDLGVTNGNFATTVSVLLAGKPLLLFPATVEQYIFARRVEQLGAGVIGSQQGEHGVGACFERLLSGAGYRAAAAAFARRHAAFDPLALNDRMCRTVECLIPERVRPDAGADRR